MTSKQVNPVIYFAPAIVGLIIFAGIPFVSVAFVYLWAGLLIIGTLAMAFIVTGTRFDGIFGEKVSIKGMSDSNLTGSIIASLSNVFLFLVLVGSYPFVAGLLMFPLFSGISRAIALSIKKEGSDEVEENS